jgi:hypothetical protein
MRARRGALWTATLLMCVASLALAPAAGAFGGTSSISGKVTEAAGAKGPVENIDVTVLEPSGEFAFAGSATTNAAGEYTVSGLEPGSYKVRFAPPSESTLNFLPQFWEDKATFAEATDLSIASGEVKTGIDAALREGGTIKGTVSNPDAQPVAEAYVSAYSGSGEFEGFAGTAKTNAKGEYSVVGLASGSYKVVVYPPAGLNLVPQFYANEPSFADATPVVVNVEETKHANVTLQVGGEISGQVTDAATHNPIAGAFVEATTAAGSNLFGGFAVTNSNGEYTIEGLATGSYDLEFFGPFEGTSYIVQTDKGVSATQGATTSGVNAALVREAPINTSAPVASGTAAVGQTLSCSNGSWSGISTINFAYKWLRDGSAIEGATNSSYTVQAADQGHGLSCEVTASNSKGSASATSNKLNVPAAPPPAPPVPSVALASNRVLVTPAGVARVPVRCATANCSGTIELVQQQVVKRRRGHKTIIRKLTIVLAEASYSLTAGQVKMLVFHLSKSGLHRLDATRHHQLQGLLVVSLRGGKSLEQSVLVTRVAAVKRR